MPMHAVTHVATVPASIAKRINGERVVLLSWPRAILLQMAHPLVAAGVAEHSRFRESPRVAIERLHATVRAMLRLTFGTAREHHDTVTAILKIHARVHGVLREAVGTYAAGTPYTATDPALVLWVHGTLLDSTLLAFRTLVGPLAPTEENAYCAEAASIAEELGARPADIPRDAAALTAYMNAVYTTNVLAVGADARAIAAAVLSGPLPWLTAPATWTNRLITTAWLPPQLRTAYGLPWTDRRERVSLRLLGAVRATRRLLPDVAARWPG